MLYVRSISDSHNAILYTRTSQTDWLANLEFKNKQFDLKMGLGRDEILVPKKGMVVLNSFNDVAMATKTEGAHLGPGNNA